MGYSQKSTRPASEVSLPPVLVSEAGVPFRPVHVDAVADWMDLMEAVEALCPQWPAREPTLRAGVFRL